MSFKRCFNSLANIQDKLSLTLSDVIQVAAAIEMDYSNFMNNYHKLKVFQEARKTRF